MPQFLRLRLHRRDQPRVGMAQRRHGDAGAEIEIAPAVAGEEIGAFAALECHVGPSIGR